MVNSLPSRQLYLLLDLRLCFTTAGGGVDGLDLPLLGTSVVAGGDIVCFPLAALVPRLCISGTKLVAVVMGTYPGEAEKTGLVLTLGISGFGEGGDCLTTMFSTLPDLFTASYASSSSLLGLFKIDV